jgi:hypothetical protein
MNNQLPHGTLNNHVIPNRGNNVPTRFPPNTFIPPNSQHPHHHLPPPQNNMVLGPNRVLVGPPPPSMRHTITGAPPARPIFPNHQHQQQPLPPHQQFVHRGSVSHSPPASTTTATTSTVPVASVFSQTMQQQQQQNPVVDIGTYNQLLDIYYTNPVDVKGVVALDLFRGKSALANTVFEEADLFNSFDKLFALVQEQIEDERYGDELIYQVNINSCCIVIFHYVMLFDDYLFNILKRMIMHLL